MIAQIPWWKRCASYFYEFEIVRVSSDLNPQMWVSYKEGRYLLNTPEAVYSYEDKYDNFGKAISHFGAERFRPSTLDESRDSRSAKEVLLLGLGMGSIPLIFEKTYGLKLSYTAVEKDPAVIELCSLYGMAQIEAPVSIIEADAYAYVMQSDEKYDVIMMDVFVDDFIPEEFRSLEYVRKLSSMLNENGLLLYNVLHATPQDRLQSTEFYNDVFLKAIPEGTFLNVGGNLILIYEKK